MFIVDRYTGFFFQADDGIRDLVRSRGLGDVYKCQIRRLLGSLAVACFATAGVWANRHGRRTVWRTALIAASLTAVTVKQAVRKHDGI